MPGEDDWEEITKSVKPLKSGKKKAVAPKLPKPLKRGESRASSLMSDPAVMQAVERLEVVEISRGFEPRFSARLDENIRNFPVLDLHGLTLDQAYIATERFLTSCFASGQKAVVIITGKGKGEEQSIPVQFKRWLLHSALARLVHSYDNAPRRHGGEGAWIIRLRKNDRV